MGKFFLAFGSSCLPSEDVGFCEDCEDLRERLRDPRDDLLFDERLFEEREVDDLPPLGRLLAGLALLGGLLLSVLDSPEDELFASLVFAG